MGKHQFTDAERYAVYETHGGRCYIGGEPVDLMAMHVDHVVPEALGDNARALASAIQHLGLPENFNVNSFANWLPACGPCNVRKSTMVWTPSLQVQMTLQRLAERAPKAAEAAAEVVSRQKLSRGVNTVLRGLDGSDLTNEQLDAIAEIVARYSEHLAPEAEEDVLRLTPTASVMLYEVLSDDGTLRIVRGAYGVGGGPSSPQPGMRCNCGSRSFNGARCVICGQLYDD